MRVILHHLEKSYKIRESIKKATLFMVSGFFLFSGEKNNTVSQTLVNRFQKKSETNKKKRCKWQ